MYSALPESMDVTSQSHMKGFDYYQTTLLINTKGTRHYYVVVKAKDMRTSWGRSKHTVVSTNLSSRNPLGNLPLVSIELGLG